ncbi:MAG TPA: glycoside hydrolase family 9 protein [Treponemataceae bacterium]|nr:glycoside hydrolase family 9 protein [Treponemataceae bacterium]
MRMRFFATVSLALCALSGLFAAPKYLAPEGKPGELVYIPYPVAITVDGDPSDWKDIERIPVETGPYLSGDLKDNGRYEFSICADKRNIYLLMTMADKKIIGGKHGRDFWNEDSFEIYFNLSGNLDAAEYGKGIVQINVNATNLKIDDPNALSLTGVRFAEEGYDVSGRAFKTADGWGIEIAIKLENNIEPYHGFTVGVQTQANGATVKDRDSKLIWSIYDTTDISWKNPRVFGTGVFFEVGKTDVPQPMRQNLPKVVKRKTIPLDKLPKVRVNQVGYFPNGPKLAALVSDSKDPLAWTLRDADGKTVASGKTIPAGNDLSSGDPIHYADFGNYRKAGKGYTLAIGEAVSFPFDIGADAYAGLSRDAMRYFYLSRIGIPLEAKYAGEAWARPAFFESDSSVKAIDYPVFPSREYSERPYTLNAGKGWMDAGDYGKYVVNGGISVWTLLNAYERDPGTFPDGSLGIPESGNGVPDVLDEVRWELEFMLGMQVPDGQSDAGMAHHKLHEKKWLPLPYKAPERTDDRFAMRPSTAATLNLAAAAAQAARVYAPVDKAFADRLLVASEKAWAAAKANPAKIFYYVSDDGGGDYDDAKVGDEFLWASCELWLTTGKGEYREYLEAALASGEYSSVMSAPNGPMSWGNTASLGMLSLLGRKSGLEPSVMKGLKSALVAGADRYLSQIRDEGYRAPFFEYEWGSNSGVLNKAILLAYAYDLTGKAKYRDAVSSCMDYVLGRNALCKSFVSGYGGYPMFYPHHRWWTDEESLGYPPPPPGVLSGGPNEKPTDDAAAFLAKKVARAKRYADDSRSYSTNEVAINWNAPLVWTSSWLDSRMDKGASGAGSLFLAVLAVVLMGLSVVGAMVLRKKRS